MLKSNKEPIYIIEIIIGIILLILDIIIPTYFAIYLYIKGNTLYMIPIVCGLFILLGPIMCILDGIIEGEAGDVGW